RRAGDVPVWRVTAVPWGVHCCAGPSGSVVASAISRRRLAVARVAPTALLVAMPQPTGPSGVHPKNWLTPGVWTMPTRAATEARLATSVDGLVPPATKVWPSWVPTRAASPTVLARCGVPVYRATAHAELAPSVVDAARSDISRVRLPPSEVPGPSPSSPA